MYDDLEIIVNELINLDVLQILGAKFNAGEKLSKLERIIADVAILSGSINNDQMYGKVNSESSCRRGEWFFDVRKSGAWC